MADPRLATIGALLGGAPEHLVERSAEARAEAQGIAVEEVLSAWAGGGEIASAPAVAVTTVREAPSPGPSAPLPPVAEPVSSPAATEQPLPALAFESVTDSRAEMVEEEIEPIEPASLAARIRLGMKVGAGLGAILGLLVMIAELPAVLGRLSEATSQGGPAVEVTWTAVVATGAAWAAAGSIITLAARGLGRFRSPSYDVHATAIGSVLSGGFIGLILGCGLGGVIYAAAEQSLSGTRLIPIGQGMVLGTLAASAVIGALIGGIGQAMALPAALAGEEADAAITVKRRLSDAVLLPVAAFLVILVIVVSFGWLLLVYHEFAPLIAILGAIGALGFAALMSSKPNLRVTRSEVLVAAAGVGVVLLMIVLIAASRPHGGEEESPEDHASVQHVSVSG